MQKYKKFQELSNKEIKELKCKWILNWFWPQIKKEYPVFKKILLYILRFCLKILWKYFTQASPDYHDYCYYIWGNESRRLACDNKFFFFICRDIDIYPYNKIKKLYLYIIASIFFIAVRIWWWIAFNYIKDDWRI